MITQKLVALIYILNFVIVIPYTDFSKEAVALKKLARLKQI